MASGRVCCVWCVIEGRRSAEGLPARLVYLFPWPHEMRQNHGILKGFALERGQGAAPLASPYPSVYIATFVPGRLV